MTERTVSAEDLRRLKREREEAERLFREALASLDRARQALPAIPLQSRGRGQNVGFKSHGVGSKHVGFSRVFWIAVGFRPRQSHGKCGIFI